MSQKELHQAAVEIQLYAALLLKFFNQALEIRMQQYGTDITSLQHGILRMLMFERLTISEISRRLGIDPSTLVRSVDSLEQKGLVKRGTDPQDRRRNPISITEEGISLFQAVPLIAPDDLPFQAMKSLGLETTEQLRDLLRDLVCEVPEGKMVVELMTGQRSDEK